MIVHDVLQGTSEWLQIRSGIPTASCFDQIITPKTGKLSSSATGYMHKLLAEKIMGHPVAEFVSSWMDRGNALEAEAIAYFEGIFETTTVRVGFLTNDAGTIGASPDRLVGDDGLLEIKVPKDETHVGYLITHAIDEKYKAQCQGQLWVSGRKWLKIMSYHPEMPPALVHVERDEEYIEKLSEAVTAFAAELARMTTKAEAAGWIKAMPHDAETGEIT